MITGSSSTKTATSCGSFEPPGKRGWTNAVPACNVTPASIDPSASASIVSSNVTEMKIPASSVSNKQCAAVTTIVGDTSVPEHHWNVSPPNSATSEPTNGWRPSSG